MDWGGGLRRRDLPSLASSAVNQIKRSRVLRLNRKPSSRGGERCHRRPSAISLPRKKRSRCQPPSRASKRTQLLANVSWTIRTQARLKQAGRLKRVNNSGSTSPEELPPKKKRKMRTRFAS